MSHGGSPSIPTPLPSPRVIPAYAGNALPERLPGPPDAVHPLIRGERSQHPADGEPDAGSSPHARGTHRGGDDPIRPVRFIPTCAGNAAHLGGQLSFQGVHPHMRGERSCTWAIRWPSIGASSHARGTHRQRPEQAGQVRFILAYAGNAVTGASAQKSRAVHPRICGERLGTPQSMDSIYGSSPHARGTRGRLPVPGLPGRFIPACAGNASRPPSHPPGTSVHPRMRGGRYIPSQHGIRRHGSSPHARGTRHQLFHHIGQHRFIPACAGNAAVFLEKTGARLVHPRMRGERAPATLPIEASFGSSPHARGTQPLEPCHSLCRRFIPACAGNAWARARQTARCAVHPRMRGERSMISCAASLASGSSPHARGTPRGPAGRFRCRRFIPACAGNAESHAGPAHPYAVHPRMRGERWRNMMKPRPRPGSSPLARGTHGHAPFQYVIPRFIPACAGNAARADRFPGLVSVHPRLRGERSWRISSSFVFAGSSPLARGTHAMPPYSHPVMRFIPACAGNAPVLAQSQQHSPGSSPLARGTRSQSRIHEADQRFIPACAGNASAAPD